LPSGDQTGWVLTVSLADTFFNCPPFSSHSQISSRPLWSLTKAIHLPSGDHAGLTSRAPGLLVSR